MARESFECTVESSDGFYIGDICYFMNEALYYGVWRDDYDFGAGCFEDVRGTGYSFAVADTAYGDGSYIGTDCTDFWVDAGVIGVVPMELAEAFGGPRDDWCPNDMGFRYISVDGPAVCEFAYDEEGMFTISVVQGRREVYHTFIDTVGRNDEDDDEEYDDDDYEEDDWE